MENIDSYRISVSPENLLLAHAYDTGDDAIITSTEALVLKGELLAAAEADLASAKANLETISSWLVSESFDDGDPARDISVHPEYIDARQEVIRYQEIVAQLKIQ